MVRSKSPRWARRLNAHESHSARIGIDCAINKDDGFGVPNFFREIGRPLLARDYPHYRFRAESPFGPVRKPWAHAVIGPQRVAAGEN